MSGRRRGALKRNAERELLLRPLGFRAVSRLVNYFLAPHNGTAAQDANLCKLDDSVTNKIAPDSKKRDGELSRLEACRGVGRDARTETETDGAMRAMWISKNRMLTNVLNRFRSIDANARIGSKQQ